MRLLDSSMPKRRLRPRIRAGTRWGSLQRSPGPLAGGEGARCLATPSTRTLIADPTPALGLRAPSLAERSHCSYFTKRPLVWSCEILAFKNWHIFHRAGYSEALAMWWVSNHISTAIYSWARQLKRLTRNILDCDQSNYSSRIIFSCRLFLQAAL